MIATQTNAKASTADLQALVAQLQAENDRLKAARNSKLSFKVSPKGCLSVYGLGRFPVSLFLSQWERLFEVIEPLKAFIAENKDKLATKE
jgi:hypothetical protein